ncbi:MAG: Ig-like domain-containing protein, partial [Bacteroidota bacterium]
MRLVSNYYIIGLFLGLLSSCAQIGTIEGGAKDENPPRVVKSSSENGTTNFKEKKIEFVFDEYFQLNNPQNTVSITPNHTRLKTSSSAKKLQIEFLDSLQPNTTYQLILNSTVKDINEGNDSLMVFVFSTGTSLDSAYFQTKIVDAFNNQPLKKMYVGLFDSLGAEPTYLQKTNDQGRVFFSYIKASSYHVKCWEDQNSSGKYDSTERVAFRKEVLELSDSIIDTIPLRLAQPEFDRIIRNVAVIEPGLIGVGLNKRENDFSFFFTEKNNLPESEI